MRAKRPSQLAIIDHRKKPKKKVAEQLILETKLIPPMPKENTIYRPRLVSLLKKNLNKKLVLITADAGYGKTTLLSQLLEDFTVSSVFYHLEPSDADFTIFLDYLIEGIKKIYPSFGERTKVVLSHLSSPFADIKMITGTLINEMSALFNKNLFVILDDYQHLDNYKPINTALEYLLGHQPHNFHLIISSRIQPSMSLIRLKAKQDIYQLNQDDLRFTKKEVELLFKRTYGIRVNLDELEQIIKRTEGWVTGLQIFAQLLASKDLISVSKFITQPNLDLFNYFTSEILLQQPPEIQTFLTKSSILDELYPEICNYILERQDSHKTIKTLVDKNLFIFTLDDRKGRYRYHQLFREFLNLKLKNLETQEEIKNLHLRAASFFVKKDYSEKAINHYLQAKEYSKVMDLIESVGEQWLAESRVDTIKRWIDELPLSLIQQNTLLLNYYAETLVWTGK